MNYGEVTLLFSENSVPLAAGIISMYFGGKGQKYHKKVSTFVAILRLYATWTEILESIRVGSALRDKLRKSPGALLQSPNKS